MPADYTFLLGASGRTGSQSPSDWLPSQSVNKSADRVWFAQQPWDAQRATQCSVPEPFILNVKKKNQNC